MKHTQNKYLKKSELKENQLHSILSLKSWIVENGRVLAYTSLAILPKRFFIAFKSGLGFDRPSQLLRFV